jgi:hypothetical protein
MLREERGAGVVGMRAAGSRGSAKAPLLLAVAAISLAGCSIVDLYSERATVYNVESEQAHDQGILLNIVRASMRRPRAYTLVQKITGQATATGAATLNFPFGPRISGSNTAAVTGGASGGPTFEVATLETSDFFQSLLLPIPASLFDLYIQGEFPRDLLFNLFIEKIVMRRADGECGALNHLRTCEIVFQNYPGRRLQLELFQALAGYLVDLNLSTQPIKQQNKPKAPAESKPGSGDRKDKTQTDAPLYVLCFAPRTIETARWWSRLPGAASPRRRAALTLPQRPSAEFPPSKASSFLRNLEKYFPTLSTRNQIGRTTVSKLLAASPGSTLL